MNEFDFKALTPGSRLRMRDWRDKSLVDTTFFAFQAMRNIVLKDRTVRLGEAFLDLKENHQVDGARLVVHRDFFCGLTWLRPGDVVERLPDLSDRERFEHLCMFFESEARDCRGCKAFIEDPNGEAKHKGDEFGGALSCVGRAVIPAMRELLAKLSPPANTEKPKRTRKQQSTSH